MTAVPVTPRDDASFYDAVRPFALVAVVAFVLGFLGYVLLGRWEPAAPQTAAASVAAAPAVAGPASDDWNFPKHI